ncbi:MAG TPA: hypothetical protein PLM53_13855 [Spirochaetota bacterium]|nr:hypothetical protein [Spirochaetota bacterium]HPC39600.1 hypothetical protein [Spirochaetota bacterium]HQF09495.1 hypothetical protein [Spirochaetota bacterium]HQH98178.1 hypothetical protein [Spirochaetota bacterium]HQJ72356.1 hypothetical protein [Spirochaetota bacterium]
MDETILVLQLGDGFCIECAAKHAYNKMVLDIMTSDDTPGPGIESMLDLLVDFLEGADFAQLRGSHEALAGVKESRCSLHRDEHGHPCVSVISP